jgi:hypothetical protein
MCRRFAPPRFDLLTGCESHLPPGESTLKFAIRQFGLGLYHTADGHMRLFKAIAIVDGPPVLETAGL